MNQESVALERIIAGPGSLYHILGVPFNASDEEVERAYKEIAKKTHPDKTQNLPQEEQEKAVSRFKQATLARDVLTNYRNNYHAYEVVKRLQPDLPLFYQPTSLDKLMEKVDFRGLAGEVLKAYPEQKSKPQTSHEKKYKIVLGFANKFYDYLRDKVYQHYFDQRFQALFDKAVDIVPSIRNNKQDLAAIRKLAIKNARKYAKEKVKSSEKEIAAAVSQVQSYLCKKFGIPNYEPANSGA